MAFLFSELLLYTTRFLLWSSCNPAAFRLSGGKTTTLLVLAFSTHCHIFEILLTIMNIYVYFIGVLLVVRIHGTVIFGITRIGGIRQSTVEAPGAANS